MFDLSLNKATLQASLQLYEVCSHRSLLLSSTLHSFHLYRSQPHRSHHRYTHYATPIFETRPRIAMPDVTIERPKESRGGERRGLRREDAIVGRCLCCKLAVEDEDSVE